MNLQDLLLPASTIALLAIVFWALIFQLVPMARRKAAYELESLDGKFAHGVAGSGLFVGQARRMFDASAGPMQTSDTPVVKTLDVDDYSDSTLDGPLVPLDCDRHARPCLSDKDCQLLCRDSNHIDYVCPSRLSICVERVVTDNAGGTEHGKDDGLRPNVNCDTKNGEYAVLQGYNDIGVAEWNCVQLYPGWQNGGTAYCEGGVVNLDAGKRAPSYRDCTCPNGFVRVVYKRSQLGQQVHGLPHCVPYSKLPMYDDDYLIV